MSLPRIAGLGPAALLLLLAAPACRAEPDEPEIDPALVNDVEPLGSLSGDFSCPVVENDADELDLGPARWEGEIAHEDYIVGLRTQGCWARLLDAARGPVVSVTLLQHTGDRELQGLELDFPRGEDGGALSDGAEVVFSGRGGFASIFTFEAPDGAPEPFLRNAGGVVTVTSAGQEEGDLFAGSFIRLRMGAIQ